MKKRWTAFFLAFLLGLGLTACGKTPGPDTNTDAPPSAAEDIRQQTSAPFSADYWTAVRHESYDAMNDCMKTSAMPTEAWWADLYLNEDGTAQFRDVLGSYYNTSLLDGNWWLGADSTLRLTGTMNTGEPLTLDGRIESTDSLVIETPYGDTFYFAPAERPGPGGEMGIADLYGTWRMTHYEEDGREYRPGEEHIASMLCFDCLWSDLLEGYVMRADWYHAAGLDTDTPQYRPEKHLLTEKLDEPLMYGLSNELWSARLYAEDSETEYYVTLTDRNTLYLQQYYELDNAPAARTAIYTREASLMPETLTLALADEPDKSLMFYWRDPPAEVAKPLEVLPVTVLEKGGQNKLLLIGRWYETDIQFCTGSAEQNEDGTLGEWITDTVLYEGTLRIDEPQWFSLTIPEKTAKLCLFMKRPWDESWFTWPITDQDPFFVSGDTFLTEAE